MIRFLTRSFQNFEVILDHVITLEENLLRLTLFVDAELHNYVEADTFTVWIINREGETNTI